MTEDRRIQSERVVENGYSGVMGDLVRNSYEPDNHSLDDDFDREGWERYHANRKALLDFFWNRRKEIATVLDAAPVVLRDWTVGHDGLFCDPTVCALCDLRRAMHSLSEAKV